MVAITYAGYGVYEKTRDVTTEIKSAYKDGARNFLAHNDWGGDPAPRERKYLFILWTDSGIRRSAVVGENDKKGINLP